MSSTSGTIAFFGATGGCAFTCLVYTLRAGYKAVALARTPSKLEKMLLDQGVTRDTLSSQLSIVQGNSLSTQDVRTTLLKTGSDQPVSAIISGLGSIPTFHWSWKHPIPSFGIENSTLCGDSARTLVEALSGVYAEHPELKAHKPLMTFISTTGITRGPEDVPWSMRYLYHHVLAVPHEDKKAMEDTYRGATDEPDEGKRVFRGVVGVRPTLLFGGANAMDKIAFEKIRVGTESQPALGYSIKRANVGEWIFREVIEKGAKDYLGEMVSLTS